jgi:glucuronate isomerase
MEHKTIFGEDFLLQSDAAKKLYHNHACHLPIIDYHNHLPINEIATDKKFENLTDIWLRGDHYKWRAMRTLGVPEDLITGKASDHEKFKAWAGSVPKLLRNPLFHWTHMELKDPFGMNVYLNEQNADHVYQHCNGLLREDKFSTRGLLSHFKVDWLCTTDDPCDDLDCHASIKKDDFAVKSYPGFRPDKALQISNGESYFQYIKRLEKTTQINIVDLDSLLNALRKRVDYFHDAGCRISDHGLVTMPSQFERSSSLENEFKSFLANNGKTNFTQPDQFAGYVLMELCKMYQQKGWVQQFHLGPMRNNNTRFFNTLGPDTGFDSIGDQQQGKNLSKFLNELDRTDQLAKTILYNINPGDNELFATMTGNFNDGSVKGKIQFGSAWWFMDQLDGMTRQINALSSLGVVSTFIGMLTDSRSFLSFSRHEYFRRLLCNIFGDEMEKGLLPNDEKWVGKIISDICYHNAKEYFKL